MSHYGRRRQRALPCLALPCPARPIPEASSRASSLSCLRGASLALLAAGCSLLLPSSLLLSLPLLLRTARAAF